MTKVAPSSSRSMFITPRTTNVESYANTSVPRLHNFDMVNKEIPLQQITVVNAVELMLLGILVICIISGNVLVICAFATVGRKMRTITNYFVVSLAVSDIFVGVFSVPCWMWLQISMNHLIIFYAFIWAP